MYQVTQERNAIHEELMGFRKSIKSLESSQVHIQKQIEGLRSEYGIPLNERLSSLEKQELQTINENIKVYKNAFPEGSLFAEWRNRSRTVDGANWDLCQKKRCVERE